MKAVNCPVLVAGLSHNILLDLLINDKLLIVY